MKRIVTAALLATTALGGTYAVEESIGLRTAGFLISAAIAQEGGVNVDALLAALPENVTAGYQAKRFDPATGLTIVNGLEFTIRNPKPAGEIPPAPAAPVETTPMGSEPDVAPIPEMTPAPTEPPPATEGGKTGKQGDVGQPMQPTEPPAETGPSDGASPMEMGPSGEWETIVGEEGTAGPADPYGVVVSSDFDEPEEVKVLITEAQVKNLTLESFQKIFDAASYTGPRDENFIWLMDYFALFGVKISGDGKEMATVGEFVVQGMQMKQLPFAPGGENFEAQFKGEEAMGFQIIGGFLDAFKMDLFAVRDLKAGVPEAGFSYNWTNYELTAIDRGKFGPYKANGFTSMVVDPTMGLPLEISMASSGGEGYDFTKVIPWMIKGELPPITERDLISIGSSYGKDIRYVVPSFGTVEIPTMDMAPVEFVWLVPMKLTFDMNGDYTLDPQAPAEMQEALGMQPGQKAAFNFGLDWAYDDAGGIADLKRFGMGLDGLWNVDLGFKFGGITLADFADTAKMATIDQRLVFNGFNFTLTDRGGTEKAIALMAKEDGMTVDQAREQMAMSASFFAMGQDGNPDPVMQPIADAIATFVRAPGVLKIVALPPAPLTAAMMETLVASPDPKAMVEAMGLKAEALPPQ